MCSHSPLSAEDCKPNKNLRMTVKAFLKSEEKKRSKDLEAATPPVQPSETPAVAIPSVEASSEVPNGTSHVEVESASAALTGLADAMPATEVCIPGRSPVYDWLIRALLDCARERRHNAQHAYRSRRRSRA